MQYVFGQYLLPQCPQPSCVVASLAVLIHLFVEFYSETPRGHKDLIGVT